MNTTHVDDDEPIDSEAAQIAKLYDISIFKAREIMDLCKSDAECIRERAEKFHRENPKIKQRPRRPLSNLDIGLRTRLDAAEAGPDCPFMRLSTHKSRTCWPMPEPARYQITASDPSLKRKLLNVGGIGDLGGVALRPDQNDRAIVCRDFRFPRG